MIRYNIEVIYNNQVRTITVNSSLYINEVIRRMLNIYDASIYDVAGIYFYNNLDVIYFDSTNDTGFDYLFGFFYNNYQSNRFYIETMEQHNNRINERMNYLVQQFQNNFIYRNQPVGNNPITINNYYNNHTTNTNHRPRNRNRNNHRDEEMAPNSPLEPAPVQNQNNQNNQNQARLYEIVFDATNINFDNYINQIWNTMLNRDTITTTAFNALPRGEYQNLRNQNIIHEECVRCGISLEDFQNDSDVIVLPCRHAFMEPQIRRWIITDQHTTCPTCRAPVQNTNQNVNQT
jgi:hypothetical protein